MSNKKLIVRLSRSTFFRKGNSAISQETKLTVLKSKSDLKLTDLIDDPELSWETIINIGECGSGIYELAAVNVSYDCESGIIDDWDLKLIPYAE